MKRRCLGSCGRLIERGSYCAACQPVTRWGNRDRTAQARFRRVVLKRDGYRCRYLLADGSRCPATDDLRACHIVALAKGGTDDLDNGLTLCGTHDRMTDRYAR